MNDEFASKMREKAKVLLLLCGRETETEYHHHCKTTRTLQYLLQVNDVERPFDSLLKLLLNPA